jgi:hypothetical protein
MSSPAHRYFRILEVGVTGLFLAPGLALLAARAYGPGLFLTGFAAVAVVAFEWRQGTHRRAIAEARRSIEAASASALEGAGPVDQHEGELVEEISASRGLARYLASRSTRLFARGRWGSHDVEIGIAVVAGRDYDTLLSYVCVLDPAVRGPFRVMTRGALTSLVRRTLDRHPVATGDARFDEGWVVDADEALARRVLDQRVRDELVDLEYSSAKWASTPVVTRVYQPDPRFAM